MWISCRFIVYINPCFDSRLIITGFISLSVRLIVCNHKRSIKNEDHLFWHFNSDIQMHKTFLFPYSVGLAHFTSLVTSFSATMCTQCLLHFENFIAFLEMFDIFHTVNSMFEIFSILTPFDQWIFETYPGFLYSVIYKFSIYNICCHLWTTNIYSYVII